MLLWFDGAGTKGEVTFDGAEIVTEVNESYSTPVGPMYEEVGPATPPREVDIIELQSNQAYSQPREMDIELRSNQAYGQGEMISISCIWFFILLIDVANYYVVYGE